MPVGAKRLLPRGGNAIFRMGKLCACIVMLKMTLALAVLEVATALTSGEPLPFIFLRPLYT